MAVQTTIMQEEISYGIEPSVELQGQIIQPNIYQNDYSAENFQIRDNFQGENYGQIGSSDQELYISTP